MGQTIHNISTANDGLGDAVRDAFDNQNNMNTELYNDKVDQVPGQGLSDNNFSDLEKAKLDGLTSGDSNVQADWDQADDTADDFIKNKPTLHSVETVTTAERDLITLVSGQTALIYNSDTSLFEGNNGSGWEKVSNLPKQTADTADVIDLGYTLGNYCNIATANTNTTFTFTNSILGGKARILINTATMPAITGAVFITAFGVEFQANTDIYLEVENNGTSVEYWLKQVSGATLDISKSLLFISSPTPRQELESTSVINLVAEATNTTSLEFFYRNIAGTYVSIGAATNTTGDTWQISSWTPTVVATEIKAVATLTDASTKEVVNNVFCISLKDTFTDTNGTAIASHTSDSGFSDFWTVISGSWIVNNNGLEINSADTSTHTIYHENNHTDAIFKFKISSFPSAASTQVILRYIDDSNYLMFFVSATKSVTIKERTGGVNVDLFVSADNFIDNTNDVELWMVDDKLTVILDKEPLASVDITNQLTGTKFGFKRAGANDTPRFDDVEIIPITTPEIDSSVAYTATHPNVSVFAKGNNTPYNDNGIADFDIVAIGTTNYMFYASVDDSGSWGGISYATSPTNDLHNWTNQGSYIIAGGAFDFAGCSVYHDGTTWHIVTADRLTGKLHYYYGTDLTSLTSHGVIKDLTLSSLYLRQSSIIVEDGIFYLFVDVRLFQPAGEFGYIGMMSGVSLTSLGDVKEVLSTPGLADDMLDLTTPHISYNSDNGYYELLYTGYTSRDGTAYPHSIGMAISKSIDGKYKRIQNTALLKQTASTIYDSGLGCPCRVAGTNIVYHNYNDSTVAGGNDGYSYFTLD